MKKLYETWPFNFGAIHKQDFKKAKIVIAPVPYNGTSSFKAGMREEPYAIIENSRHVDELLEDETGERLTGLKATDIFTLDEIVLSRNSAREAINGIEQAIYNGILKHKKISSDSRRRTHCEFGSDRGNPKIFWQRYGYSN